MSAAFDLIPRCGGQECPPYTKLLAQSKYEQHNRERNDEHGSNSVEVSGEPSLFFAIFESRKECWSVAAGERRGQAAVRRQARITGPAPR